MKRFVCVTTFVGVVCTAISGFAEDNKRTFDSAKGASPAKADAKDQGKQDPNLWMKAKQQHAHEIFSGLTEGDLKKVEQGASMMYGVGYLERWLADSELKKHSSYEGQANAFEYSLKEMVRHAKEEDINGALNDYLMMSRTCVRCHRLIRDAEE